MEGNPVLDKTWMMFSCDGKEDKMVHNFTDSAKLVAKRAQGKKKISRAKMSGLFLFQLFMLLTHAEDFTFTMRFKAILQFHDYKGEGQLIKWTYKTWYAHFEEYK